MRGWARGDRLRVFGLREWRARPGRILASLVVTAVSAMYLVAVFGIFGSVTGSVSKLSGSIAGNATLEVSGIGDGGFPAAVADAVAAAPGVRAAVPMVRVSLPTASGPVLLLGADSHATALSDRGADALSGPVGALLNVPNGVLAGPGLDAPTGTRYSLGQGWATVAAVPRGGPFAALDGGRYVLAPLGLAQRLSGRPGQLDSVLVVADPAADAGRVRAAVTAAVAGRAVVAEPSMRAAQAGDGVAMMKYMALMGAAVAFVVSAFLIYTTATMAIAQRRRLLSTLRAIGGRRGAIVGDLLLEAALLGALGAAVGAALGVLAGRWAILRLPPVITQGLAARLQYSLPGYAIPAAVAVTVLTSVAAAAVGARQIYRISPVEALAAAEVSGAETAPRALRLACGIAAVALFAAGVPVALAHIGAAAVLAMSALFCAEIAIGFAFSEQLVRAGAWLARRCGAAGALAGAAIERAPRRVWATAMTVFVAVITTIGITGTDNDMLRSAGQVYAPVAAADAWISADPPDTLATDLLPDGLAAAVAAVPGVASVTSGQLAFATVGSTRVLLDGVAPGSDDALLHAADESARAGLLAGNGVILSKDLGRTLHVGAGDTLTLQTPTGPHRVAVLRLVPYFATVIGSVGISADLLRTWFGRAGSSMLQVAAAPGADHTRLLAGLRRVTPDQDHVYDGAAALAGAQAPLRQSMLIANAVWVIVAFVSAVALLNTLTLSVLQRRREIGVLRAIGADRWFMLRAIAIEAGAIAAAGAGLGVLFGLLNQRLIGIVTPDIMNFDVHTQFSPLALAFAAAAVAISLVGATPPAVRAAQLPIVDAVSTE